jgi:hypothetical protein
VDEDTNTQVARPPDREDERGERNEDRRIEPGLPEVIEREETQVDPGSGLAVARQAWREVASEVQLLDDWADEAVEEQQRAERSNQDGPVGRGEISAQEPVWRPAENVLCEAVA